MKPLLERKRRARINKCLDNLKDLMVSALQSEGESITKLEKADVLELTVRHLQKLKRQNALGLTPEATYAGRFKAGYAHCAQEVSKFMSNNPVVNVEVNSRLFGHLSNCMQALDSMPPSVLSMAVPPIQTPTTPMSAPISPPNSVTPPPMTLGVNNVGVNNSAGFTEEQLTPLDLIKNSCYNKENQVQDLSVKKNRAPLTNVNDKWRPW